MPRKKQTEKIAFEECDHENLPVIWGQESYSRHVVKHPEIRQLKNYIKQALTAPYHISHKKGYKYYYSDVVRYSGRLGELRMKVVVKKYGKFFRKFGRIKTCHLVSAIDE